MKTLNASDLLDTFTAAGLFLSLTPDSALKVTPAKALNDELRATIKANKIMLVDYLKRTAANDTITTSSADPDRWHWPHSTAMNSGEIDTYTMQLARFTDKGMSLEDAERLADKLVIRDREGDDRRLCLECTHLQGFGCWRCSNWLVANVARDELGPDLVWMLQRCAGFKAAWIFDANFQMFSENLSVQKD